MWLCVFKKYVAPAELGIPNFYDLVVEAIAFSRHVPGVSKGFAPEKSLHGGLP